MRCFAYGSNMLTRRLTAPSRAPSAFACGIAGAPGFVVRFHKMGADGSGKCTLVAAEDAAAVAYGVLYELSDSDGTKLDRVEGVHTGGYIRSSIKLRCLDGDTTGAVTYIANDRHVNPDSVPFDWYRDLGPFSALVQQLLPFAIGDPGVFQSPADQRTRLGLLECDDRAVHLVAAAQRERLDRRSQRHAHCPSVP